ncbi:hypothetical protein A2U01_0057726, partial [Trifolium medium]|nr:hypothetical protein [Trifolium medium]
MCAGHDQRLGRGKDRRYILVSNDNANRDGTVEKVTVYTINESNETKKPPKVIKQK